MTVPLLDNFCRDKLSNLILLAVFDNIIYAVASIVFSIFFVKMPPGIWYRYTYPLIGGVVLGLVISLWYVEGVLAYIVTR